MSRSFINLRRALFGTSCVIVFGFGATEVLAAPAQASKRNPCYEELHNYCADQCRLQGEHLTGYCNGIGPYFWCECVGA